MEQEDKNKEFTQSLQADKWAKAFMEIVNKGIEIDEGLMIGWFANAIMRGYDEACRRGVWVQQSKSTNWICGVWDHEPTIEERIVSYSKYLEKSVGGSVIYWNTYITPLVL